MVLQKYFDQWDYAFKLLGDKLLQIVLNNWNAAKVGLIIGEEPSPHFFSRIFAKYQVVVEEGLNTAIQRQQEFQQTLELNQALGGIIPASYIASIATLQGKNKLMEVLGQQEQQQQAMAQEQHMFMSAAEDAKIKELYSKAAMNIANARERHSRSDSNLGLFEERLSMISKNRAAANKDKVEALNKLIEAIHKYGEVETLLKEGDLESLEVEQIQREGLEKMDAKRTSAGNEFIAKMLSGLSAGGQGQQGQPQPQGDMGGMMDGQEQQMGM